MNANLLNIPPVQNAELSVGSARLVKGSTGAGSGNSKAAARQAAEEFETIFLNTMLQSMFEGVEVQEPFGGGYGEQAFRSMMVNEYAKDIAASGGIGIADHVYREILAQQERGDQ